MSNTKIKFVFGLRKYVSFRQRTWNKSADYNTYVFGMFWNNIEISLDRYIVFKPIDAILSNLYTHGVIIEHLLNMFNYA